MGLVRHAEYELKQAGYNIENKKNSLDTEQDYADMIGRCALELIKVFAKQGHSGMSASFTLQLFDKLARYQAISKLTDNPEEWIDITNVSGGKNAVYQSKRDSSCFSLDLKTYYDIDDPDNNIFEEDENGNKTGYATLRPLEERKMVELVHVI